MRKPTQDERNAFVGIGAIVLFVCALSFVSPDFRNEPYNGGAGAGAEQNYPWWGFATFWEALGTWAIAAYAVRQYRASDNTAKRQLRAYVTVTSSRIANASEGQTPVLGFNFKNTGQTPAYDVYVRSDAVISVYPPPFKGFLPSNFLQISKEGVAWPRLSVGVLGAGQDFFREHKLDRPISAETFGALTGKIPDKLTGGALAIYLWGEIRYRDAFNHHWQLDFRYVCAGDNDDMTVLRVDEVQEKEIDEKAHSGPLKMAGVTIPWSKNLSQSPPDSSPNNKTDIPA